MTGRDLRALWWATGGLALLALAVGGLLSCLLGPEAAAAFLMLLGCAAFFCGVLRGVRISSDPEARVTPGMSLGEMRRRMERLHGVKR